jgi:U3 small nucleolar RNA-associated protein 4
VVCTVAQFIRLNNVLIDKGLDTNLVILPVRDFFQDYPRYISTLPQVPPVASASSSRLVLSWWEREINIWRFKKQNASAIDEKVHKLVARVGLQGDENITCAAISSDGNFLIVSTAAEVKLFQIQNKQDGGLRIRKIDLEKPLGGARLIQLSPDGKWLAIVNHSSDVRIARVVIDDTTGNVRLLPKLIELERLTRTDAEAESLDGLGRVVTKAKRNTKTASPLGVYARTVTRVQFSPDSKALAASDLSGYIDSWLLEGHEDTTASEIDVATYTSTEKASDSDEDDDQDDETTVVILLGQHWRSNPSSELLPKLESAPLLLSFRPSIPEKKQKREPNGNPAVHPTRNNPHPIAHTTPTGSYKLVVLTAYHRLFEFDILAGKLTEWSKRNPSANLPEKFTIIKDRAMGCTWHVKGTAQRLWIYGSSWLSMFDLSQDFDAPLRKEASAGVNTEILGQGQKRKREAEGGGKLNKNQVVGFAPKIRKIVDGKVVSTKKRTEDETPVLDDPSSEDEEEIDMGGRLNGREETIKQTVLPTTGKSKPKKEPEKFWNVHRYRSVLGMASIGDSPECLEMVIIERPPLELDMLPSFKAHYER